MKLGAKLDMVILGRIYAPSKGPKWAQRGEKLTTKNHTTRKINKNEKNMKLRVFIWLVSLPKGRYRSQAPYADVSESLGLRGPLKRSYTCFYMQTLMFCNFLFEGRHHMYGVKYQ